MLRVRMGDISVIIHEVTVLIGRVEIIAARIIRRITVHIAVTEIPAFPFHELASGIIAPVGDFL